MLEMERGHKMTSARNRKQSLSLAEELLLTLQARKQAEEERWRAERERKKEAGDMKQIAFTMLQVDDVVL